MEPTSTIIEHAQNVPLWLQGVLAVISLIVTSFLVPLLKRWSDAAKAQTEKAQADTNYAAANAQTVIIAELKSYLLEAAQAILEREFMSIVQKAATGGYKEKNAVKDDLHRLGTLLRNEAVEHFKGRGIDIIALVGEPYLKSLIEQAANKVSPFPGKETAVALLQDGVANLLLKKGVEYVRDNFPYVEAEATAPAAPATPAN